MNFHRLTIIALLACVSTAFATPTKLELPVGTPFNQKHTMYCWAYSAYHSLRTYYLHGHNTGDDFVQWKKAIQDLDSSKKFWDFVHEHFSNHANEPMSFVRGLMKADSSLHDQHWTAYIRRGMKRYTIPFDRTTAKYLKIDAIKKKIKDALEKGIPTAYCGNGHCTSIYGAIYEDDKATKYLIADSVNGGSSDGRTYEKSANSVHSSLEIILGME